MSVNYQPVDAHATYQSHPQNDERFNVHEMTGDAQAHNAPVSAKHQSVYSQTPYYDHTQYDSHANSSNVYENVPIPPFYGQVGGETTSYPIPNGEKPGDPTRPRVAKGRIPRLWMWEILASVFSLICIAVIVIVLIYEDGKRLDGWALMISPNAVIAFITTLAKSSCLLVLAEVIGQLRWVHFTTASRQLSDLEFFDAGSRGPWGALRLMFRMKTAATLASAASLLTIAALVIDPFAQLVFTFPTRPTPTPLEVASIGLARVYDANTSVTANHGVPYPVAQNAPFQLQSAVISAAFGVSPRFDITCPTSNCTFPPISTLGICSTCENVVDVTNTTCGIDSRSRATVCNTTVPHQLLPGSNFTWSVSNDAAGSYARVWNSSSMGVTPSMAALAQNFDQPALLAAFTALKLDKSLFTGNGARPTKPSQVNQCMFVYCMKTYNGVNVSSGRTVIGSVDEAIMKFSSHQWFLDPPQTGNPLFTMQPSANGQTVGPNYTMNWWDHLNLGQYMRDVFNSSVYLNTGTYQPGQGGKMAPSFGLAMYNADNLTVMAKEIADSMTNSMRTTQNNITTVNGTALINETYIHIEWKWLALPIAISVLSLVLLITVMINSRSHGVDVWKSSSLPLLFYGLEGWDRQMTHGFVDRKDLRERSKDMIGHLSLDNDHPAFVRDGASPGGNHIG
ncbi:hypothetical protein PGQ11_010428 [Apiospora arundinis]|uniref:Uncharacterized protein n=1 Tax=Apiospora arundinis TaxID=335852 RepID=A0ABR2I9K9_9PEZI